MTELNCAVYAENAETARDLAQLLEGTGCISSLTEVSEARELARAVEALSPDLLLLALGEKADLVFAVAESLREPRPVLVFLGPVDRSDWILQAMRLGGREYLPPMPDAAVLSALLERIARSQGQASRSAAPGPIVSVVGAKGGVGTTVVACQFAAAMQGLGHRSCLVDLNLRRGDVGIHMDVSPRLSLADVARTRSRVDASFMSSILEPHASGLSLVLAPAQPEDGELVRPEHVAKALRMLRTQFDCLVVDLPSLWDESALRALDLSDALLLVTTPELSALAHTRKQLDLLARIGIPSERVALIQNRSGARETVRHGEAAEFLGRSFDHFLPNDYISVSHSIHFGASLGRMVPGSRLAQSLRELAAATAARIGLEERQAEEIPHGFGARIRRLVRRN